MPLTLPPHCVTHVSGCTVQTLLSSCPVGLGGKASPCLRRGSLTMFGVTNNIEKADRRLKLSIPLSTFTADKPPGPASCRRPRRAGFQFLPRINSVLPAVAATRRIAASGTYRIMADAGIALQGGRSPYGIALAAELQKWSNEDRGSCLRKSARQ